MPKQTITLISPHPVDECRRRLKENVGASFWGVFSDKKAAGSISDGSLDIRKRIGYGNAFQKRLSAKYIQTPQGTVIDGRFGTHPLVWAFLVFWYAFVLLFAAVFRLDALPDYLKNDQPFDAGAVYLMLFFLAFAVVPVFFAAIGGYLAKDEPVFLKKFLIDLLEAEKVKLQQATDPDRT